MNGWERVAFAFRCFFSILFEGSIPDDISTRLPKSGPAVREPVASPAPATKNAVDPETYDRAVQMLALLQRDGRLVDFLMENISSYPDVQLGAAVRNIHETCRQVLDNYVKLEPILNAEEDQPVTVPAGFDSAAIKLIGNVSGTPPLRGLLRHKGWHVKEVNLPGLPLGTGRMVIAPAEVELS